ncbi:2-dehydro-3-deoxyglucarate aldolase [Verminephrobacter aporrectodeae subsp. tuberculatae]|uniref:2-dehydro-3-deoxyglucarate aldolase n=1 Tax=Verminephrobacter aporrectodeae TaxID=1110389 RepID=UPI00223880D5|nr:2-dehydro-3-deoxyglucarate aldolase [Verminephrobacter aporrectodeae]MCW5222908.1 2-dehydro-3-deoxyglucarate aldolase [Verminephrobacter aporrectodeae subsp. tuberculatae]MCW5288372.1 2-dehydro-3-deoxyglucarate aldolase [Verminephrobacter aporrectodeae subsp. tuberculatae]
MAYTALPNSFRRDILARRRLIGCWSSLTSHITTEILGQAGFDWILLDCEHAPNDLTTLIPQLMALKDSRSAPVVRPPANDPVLIKRLLDIGFVNLLLPFIESAAAAQRAVAATRYPPLGIRGVSNAQRCNRYGAHAEYAQQIHEHLCVLLQIESRAGIDALDEILQVPGVDGIFIGPADLSAALGHFGDPGHREVQAAIADIHARSRAAGKAVGILTVVEADARRYIEQGFEFVAVGTDQALFRSATQGLRERFPSDGPMA